MSLDKYKEPKKNRIFLEKSATGRLEAIKKTDTREIGEPIKAYKYAYSENLMYSSPKARR